MPRTNISFPGLTEVHRALSALDDAHRSLGNGYTNICTLIFLPSPHPVWLPGLSLSMLPSFLARTYETLDEPLWSGGKHQGHALHLEYIAFAAFRGLFQHQCVCPTALEGYRRFKGERNLWRYPASSLGLLGQHLGI